MFCNVCVGKGAGTEEELNGLLNCSNNVTKALKSLNIHSRTHIIDREQQLTVPSCDFVFNLCDNDEGFQDSYINFTTFLELHSTPYTGNASRCFKECFDKLLWSTKIATAINFPYRSDSIYEQNTEQLPLILKHKYKHGSLYDLRVFKNINEEGIIDSLNSKQYFYEKFIEGEELVISYLPGQPAMCGVRNNNASKVFDFHAKWHENNSLQIYTPVKEELNTINLLVKTVKEVFYVNSYMRLDVKKDNYGKLYLIDVNPNCSLDPNGAFSMVNSLHGIDYLSQIRAILNNDIKNINKCP